MFKSKIDFNAFDKNNSKVKNLDTAQVKTLAKAGTKKLLGKEGEKTDFHLIIDYFMDDASGKSLGHFFDFGTNKKLSKHFEQVEMKAGKQDQSMSESPKKACSGEAYVKTVNGKKLVHIEPSPNSKVPKGQWPKILKSLKAFFGGMKAVVVVEGEVIEELVEPGDEKESAEMDSTENAAKPQNPNASVAESAKVLLNEITDVLKNKLAQVVVTNVKSKKVTQEDINITSGVLDKIQDLKDLYNGAAPEIKEKLTKHYDTILQQVPKIEKIQSTVEKLLGIDDDENEDETSEADSEEANALKELLDKVNKELGAFENNFAKIKEDISKTASAAIKGGEDLLKALF